MHCNHKPAIVLTSGGLDSTTCLAVARRDGFSPLYSMTFDYGQRHRHELSAAEAVARRFGVIEHRVIHIDLRQFGKSALTSDMEVPRDQIDVEAPSLGSDESGNCGEAVEVPITYVPARNTIFLSYALAWAEVLDLVDLFIGVNAVDYSGYPDCRPEFIKAFEAMSNLATRMTTRGGRSLKIHTPLLDLSKARIIHLGMELGVDYSMTHSCYDPDASGGACGHCDSCLLRKRGFAEAGVKDPTRYTSIVRPPGGARAGDSAK